MLIFFLIVSFFLFPYTWHETKINFIWKNYNEVRKEKVIYFKNLLNSFFYSLPSKETYSIFFEENKNFSVSKLRKEVFIPELDFDKTFSFLNKEFSSNFDYKSKRDYVLVENFNGEIFISRWQAGYFFVEKKEKDKFLPIIFDKNFVEVLDRDADRIVYRVKNYVYLLDKSESRLIFDRENFKPLNAKLLNKIIYIVGLDEKLKETVFFKLEESKTEILFKIKNKIEEVLFSKEFIFFTVKNQKFILYVYSIKNHKIRKIFESKNKIVPLSFEKNSGIVVYNRDIYLYNFRGKRQEIAGIKEKFVFENYNSNFFLFLYRDSDEDNFRKIFGKSYYFKRNIYFLNETSPYLSSLIENLKRSERLCLTLDSKFIYSVVKGEDGLRCIKKISLKKTNKGFKKKNRRKRIILLINLFILFIFLIVYTISRKKYEKRC